MAKMSRVGKVCFLDMRIKGKFIYVSVHKLRNESNRHAALELE